MSFNISISLNSAVVLLPEVVLCFLFQLLLHLAQHGSKHKYDFAEAEGFFELGHQIFILYFNVFDALPQLLLYFYKISHFALQALHLYIFQLLFRLLKLVIHLEHMLESFLVRLRLGLVE